MRPVHGSPAKMAMVSAPWPREYRLVAISGGTGTAPDPAAPKESTMADKPVWSNLFADRKADEDYINRFNALRDEYAAHLVNTGRVKAAEPGFKVNVSFSKFGKPERVVGWAYTALPKDKQPTEAQRLQRELEEARIELERLRAEAAKPRLVKARA